MSESHFESQPYSGIATFGRQRFTRDLTGVDVAVVGVPYDSATSYRSGARFGPRGIREQSLLLWGYHNALAVAPFQALSVIDYGDLDVVPVDILATQQKIESAINAIISTGTTVLTLGGDHSITLPLLRAHARRYGPLAVIHFDAHPDTWDSEFDGHKYSHGTTFRRALEEELVDTSAYLQIGIRGPTAGPEDYANALRLGARMITADEVFSHGVAEVIAEIRNRIANRPVYLSFDIDAIDPAFAPGTGTPEVGGPTSQMMLQILRGLKGLKFVGFDLVEVAPPFDHSGITSILAANLAFEFLALRALRPLQ
jgi:agmatinase/guanidinopropionase